MYYRPGFAALVFYSIGVLLLFQLFGLGGPACLMVLFTLGDIRVSKTSITSSKGEIA
jgi:hypothetical protein